MQLINTTRTALGEVYSDLISRQGTNEMNERDRTIPLLILELSWARAGDS